jgi:Helix-turn-helix domain
VTAPAEQPYFMTGDEAAAFLRVSRRTLERYRYEGTPALRYFKVGTGKRSGVRYLKSDLIAFMEQSALHATSEYPKTEPRQMHRNDES